MSSDHYDGRAIIEAWVLSNRRDMLSTEAKACANLGNICAEASHESICITGNIPCYTGRDSLVCLSLSRQCRENA